MTNNPTNEPTPYAPPASKAIEITPQHDGPRFQPRVSEDWLTAFLGLAILMLLLILSLTWGESTEKGLVNPLKSWLGTPGAWKSNPADGIKSFTVIGVTLVACAVIGIFGGTMLGRPTKNLLIGVSTTVLLACLAYVLSGQEVIKYYNLEYALWALLIGLVISNTIGTPQWLRSAAMTEFYIKTGLVMLGAEILFGQLVALGMPGICVAWVVTPIVLISTFWFGQRVLKMESATLNMVISADMSVCGVSAAIATAAACRAKKEELSLAVGMSLSFTVVMMIVMPWLIRQLGLSDVVGGAWMGGTIDSTGAVVAAGAILGDTARDVAATVKMIQNILIGVVAFVVAWYWVRFRGDQTGDSVTGRPGLAEVWKRFPKFILGFVAASLFFSVLGQFSANSDAIAQATISVSKTLRGWFFCIAFVCIGLETNFAQLARYMRGGKPLVLYLTGQTLNLLLTLFMAWLAFEVLFPQVAESLEKAVP